MSAGDSPGEPRPLDYRPGVAASPPAERIVSLVPSLTEALFALGLGPRVVGVTDWCVHPARELAALPRVGGTRTPDVAAILALRPDLVIANREENRRRDVEELRGARIPVWVTYPRTVREAVVLLGELGGLGARPETVAHVVEPVREALERAETERARIASPPRVFCPIWRDPWMSVGADTYAHDLIELCGGRNVFAQHGERRYPRVQIEDVVAAQPEVVLLPDEPYAFGAADVAELAALEIPAARAARIHPIDGTLVSWYGPRIREAIETLLRLFQGGG